MGETEINCEVACAHNIEGVCNQDSITITFDGFNCKDFREPWKAAATTGRECPTCQHPGPSEELCIRCDGPVKGEKRERKAG